MIAKDQAQPEGVPRRLSCQVEPFVKQTLALSLRKTRLDNLVLLDTGILIAHTLCLSQISRTFPDDHTDNHKLRRLWRFLSNPHPQPTQVFPQIVQFVALCWPACLPFPILLDWSRAGDYDVLTASVPWHGRSLVLCTQPVRRGKWLTLDSRNQVMGGLGHPYQEEEHQAASRSDLAVAGIDSGAGRVPLLV